MLDRQGVFDRVSSHLRQLDGPVTRTVMGERRSVYRGDDGRMCGLGIFMDDDAFDPSLNDVPVADLAVVKMLQESGLATDLVGDDIDFLVALQNAHDGARTDLLWRLSVMLRLANVAQEYGLVSSQADACIFSTRPANRVAPGPGMRAVKTSESAA